MNMMNYILFPILDSTGWYLKCDTLVCPVAEKYRAVHHRGHRVAEVGGRHGDVQQMAGVVRARGADRCGRGISSGGSWCSRRAEAVVGSRKAVREKKKER